MSRSLNSWVYEILRIGGSSLTNRWRNISNCTWDSLLGVQLKIRLDLIPSLIMPKLPEIVSMITFSLKVHSSCQSGILTTREMESGEIV
jgi:hypothetical protein